ncbi:hypothetical protein BASA60_006352 [Batrachochytrium salamandrivorans]|nr:hypothetical protein BASA60_006352 [Batrachochytrium salamandrivorans]
MPVAVCLGQQAYDEGLWAKIGAAVPSGDITAGTTPRIPCWQHNTTLPAGGITNTTVLPGSSNSTSIALPTTNADKSAAATTSMAQSTNRPTSSPSVSVPPSALNAGKSAHSAMASLTITFAILGTLFAVSL